MTYPIKKELRPAYGFDDVAIAPGRITINPEMVDTTMSIPMPRPERSVTTSAVENPGLRTY